MYENAIDGEHLPWLHSTSFARLEILDKGDWGWHASANFVPLSFMTKVELELRLDRENNRWVTRTLSGLGKGTEVWTYALPIAENKVKVVVDFYIPKLPKFLVPTYSKQLIKTYTKLYDEDLWMMATRQSALNQLDKAKTITAKSMISLGKLATIKSKLPFTFEFNHQSYRLIELEDTLIAHTLACPHMLGPLQDANVEKGILECPWHGYQFDLKTRKCISGQRCKLAPAPLIKIDTDKMEVVALANNR